MNEALRALLQGKPPGVFGECRAAIDALPGDKTAIFAAMPEGKKREAIDDLTKSVGKYIHSGRHVVPSTGECAVCQSRRSHRNGMTLSPTSVTRWRHR